MALKDIEKAVEEFLTTEPDAVLALSGPWGCGKTHLWKQQAKEIMLPRCVTWGGYAIVLYDMARPRYAYVSAANCESIEALKKTIVGSTLSRRLAAKIPTLQSLVETVTSVSSFLPIVGGLPKLSIRGVAKILTSGFDVAADLITKDAIIVIDDVERADKINPHDILHFAAWLRDDRNCKVALLLNVDQIKKRKRKDFRKAIEKGTNQFILLNPTAEEAFELWEKSDKSFPACLSDPLKKACKDLDICNIRLIQQTADALLRWKGVLGIDGTGQSPFPEEIPEFLVRETALWVKILRGSLTFDALDKVSPYSDVPIYCLKKDELFTEIKSILENKEKHFQERHEAEILRSALALAQDWHSFVVPVGIEPIIFNNVNNGFLGEQKKTKALLEDISRQCADAGRKRKVEEICQLCFSSTACNQEEIEKEARRLFEDPLELDWRTVSMILSLLEEYCERSLAAKLAEQWKNCLPDMDDSMFALEVSSGDEELRAGDEEECKKRRNIGEDIRKAWQEERKKRLFKQTKQFDDLVESFLGADSLFCLSPAEVKILREYTCDQWVGWLKGYKGDIQRLLRKVWFHAQKKSSQDLSFWRIGGDSESLSVEWNKSAQEFEVIRENLRQAIEKLANECPINRRRADRPWLPALGYPGQKEEE